MTNHTDELATDERRIGDRMPYPDRVMVVCGDAAWFAPILDLSEGGCGIARQADCTLDEEQVVRLFFYPADGGRAVIVPARIARLTEARVGIEYQEPQTVPPTHRAP